MDAPKFSTCPPVFAHLDTATVQALTGQMEVKQLCTGEVLFHQGDPGDSFYILTAGKLCVLLRQADGLQTCVNELEPGDCVGEMALLTGQPRIATIVASGDTQLMRLSKAAFDRLAEEHPQLLSQLADQLLPRFQRVQVSLILTRLFGSLDEATLCDLEGKLEWQRLDSGQVLFRQGDPGDKMYIVIQGRLRFLVDQPGGGQRPLGEVGAGESIGEFALLAEDGSLESRRSATVIATRLTDVVAFSRPVFESLLCQYPRALLNLTRQVIQRQRVISQSVLPPVSALVIAVLPANPSARLDLLNEFACQLADALSNLGPTLYLDPRGFDLRYGKPGAAQTPIDHPTSLMINAWLDEREREQQYVLYAASPPLDETGRLTPWAQRCLKDADLILLAGQEGDHPAPAAVEAALASIQTRARMELVLLHPAGCSLPSGTAAWLEARRSGAFPVQVHHHVRLEAHPADFRRLARRVSGHPVGLALAGGGARGWAHIGAIQALEETGLEVDWIAGASMGSILAAGYALDWPSGRLCQLAAQFSNPKKLLDYTFPYASITATRRITAMLQELCAGANIEDTWRPYFSISTNLTRDEEQVHLRGPLWKAARASMAFPAVFAPVLDEGCVLIDGGAANNLPVDRMREMCPTGTVIGVELITRSPISQQQYDFGPSLSGWQALLGRFNPFARRVKAPTLIDIVNGILVGNSLHRLNEIRSCADLLIQVPVEAYGLLEFDRYAEVIELGYRAAKEQLKDFKVK